jgi:hypothetical protein
MRLDSGKVCKAIVRGEGFEVERVLANRNCRSRLGRILGADSVVLSAIELAYPEELHGSHVHAEWDIGDGKGTVSGNLEPRFEGCHGGGVFRFWFSASEICLVDRSNLE